MDMYAGAHEYAELEAAFSLDWPHLIINFIRQCSGVLLDQVTELGFSIAFAFITDLCLGRVKFMPEHFAGTKMSGFDRERERATREKFEFTYAISFFTRSVRALLVPGLQSPQPIPLTLLMGRVLVMG
jgi:hypothetical protein